MIAFECQDIVGLRRGDILGERFLGPQRIDGDNTSCQIEQLQQVLDGSDLVGVLGTLHLAQDHSILEGPGTHQVRCSPAARSNERRSVLPSMATPSPSVALLMYRIQ